MAQVILYKILRGVKTQPIYVAKIEGREGLVDSSGYELGNADLPGCHEEYSGADILNMFINKEVIPVRDACVKRGDTFSISFKTQFENDIVQEPRKRPELSLPLEKAELEIIFSLLAY